MSGHLIRLQLSKTIKELARRPLPDTHQFLRSETNVLDSANHAYKSLLILLCARLETFNKVPYGVMLNPNWKSSWESYAYSLQSLLNFISKFDNHSNDLLSMEINSLDSNTEFVQVLKGILDSHHDNIVEINQGMKETGYRESRSFLNDHLKERILLQLICNNHIMVSLNGKGIVDRNLNVLNTIQESIAFVKDMSLLKYGETPKFNITSIISSNDQYIKEDMAKSPLIFPYIESHIQYVLQELLKNSSRATLENKIFTPIDILVTLINDQTTPILQIKISDHGLGINPKLRSHLWDYSFTTVKEQSNNSPTVDNGIVNSNIIAGMGYGLPLSLTYCKLFGGDIRLQSIYKRGTDVYCQFRGF